MINLSEEEQSILFYNYSYFIDHKKEAEELFKFKWKLISEYASILWSNFRYHIAKRWTEEELKVLEIKYFYYTNHKDEAESYFKIFWNDIEQKALELGFGYINSKKWKKEEIDDLKKNYSYYIEHIDEAKNRFRRRWNIINKKAISLELIYSESFWNDEQIKDLKENYFYYLDHKEEAENKFKKDWTNISSKAKNLGATSMKINKNCSMFLGCHVAENVLSHVFKDVQRMPNGNEGFDFICNKGFKIDVKSSCLRKNNTYSFGVRCNKIADYFLCIGFDNREDLNPQHIWLIKSNETVKEIPLNDLILLTISNNLCSLSQFSKYELTDKLKETIDCCTELKSKHKPKLRIIRRKKVI